MTFGTFLIIQSNEPLEQPGFEDPFTTARMNCHSFLDGIGWKPLSSSEWDYEKIHERLRKEVFPNEYAQFRNRQKIFLRRS